MMRSLFSGVSGLKNHQIRMDVIGNNISNVNTVGFKRSRVAFQEMMLQTIRGAGAPQAGRGGTNPAQIGLGVNTGTIDAIFTQGSLQSTGRVTDLAIQGDGFFILSDGTDNYYTRAGNFDLDRDGYLIDKGTGMRVYGWTADSAGNVNTSVPIGSINVPIGRSYPPTSTTTIYFGGNLNSASTLGTEHQTTMDVYDSQGNVHRIISTFTPTEDPGDPGNKLANTWEFTVALDSSDALVQNYLATYYPSFSTMSQSSQDAVLAQASEVFLGGYASATGVGRSDGAGVHITSKTLGDNSDKDRIVLQNGAWAPVTVTNPNVNGGNDIIVTLPINTATLDDLVDVLTNPLNANYDAGAAALVDASLDAGVTGTNQVNVAETVQLANGSDSVQTGTVVFTSSGVVDEAATRTANGATAPNLTNSFMFQPEGTDWVEIVPDVKDLTQYTAAFTAQARRQNGNPSGTLQTINVSKTGTVSGVFSNGFTMDLGMVCLSIFNNPAGLLRMGDNLFKESSNSGSRIIGSAETGGRGTIVPGSLEMSNVDLAQEFTDMIITQRGFQANTRIITTSDEMLQELANLKR